MDWFINFLKKIANFQGRASRKEYWTYMLLNILKTLVIYGILMYLKDKNLNIRLPDIPTFIKTPFIVVSYIMGAMVLVSQYALMVRRLHDVGKNGWWLLTLAFPFAGFIYINFLFLKKGDPNTNEYGENPYSIRQENAEKE